MTISNPEEETDSPADTETAILSITSLPDSHITRSWTFFQSALGSPRHICAPMVDQSGLAFRCLTRRHQVHLAYTPMWHASQFVQSACYRHQSWECEVAAGQPGLDRPLIVQFCANDPETFTKAALLVQDSCDAVDLNLGCPQSIAKRGHYGAFLQEDWDLVCRMISECRRVLRVPVTAKIRVMHSVDLTVSYAQRLQAAGISLLTVHGRNRDMKGQFTGVADWTHIAAVKQAVRIPVVANGNIEYKKDVEQCLRVTGADAVMSAEGLLHNPALFAGGERFVWELAEEYLQLAVQYPHEYSVTFARGHVFKMMHHALQAHLQIRDKVATGKTVEDLMDAVRQLRDSCGSDKCSVNESNLRFPHWIAQPYRRPPLKKDATPAEATPATGVADDALRQQREERKRHKIERKLQLAQKLLEKSESKRRKVDLARCVTCTSNPKGSRCAFDMCRTCCKSKAQGERVDCAGHGFLYHTWTVKRLAGNESGTVA